MSPVKKHLASSPLAALSAANWSGQFIAKPFFGV